MLSNFVFIVLISFPDRNLTKTKTKQNKNKTKQKPNQTKPNQTKPNQTKPNQTKPEQNRTKTKTMTGMDSKLSWQGSVSFNVSVFQRK